MLEWFTLILATVSAVLWVVQIVVLAVVWRNVRPYVQAQRTALAAARAMPPPPGGQIRR